MDIKNKLIKLGLYFNNVMHDDINRIFNPTCTKQRFEKVLLGCSSEFCHNLYRLIMRPNNMSSQYWFTEASTWFNTALTAKLSVKKLPIYLLFAEVLDENTKEFPLGHCSKHMYSVVYKESCYGPVTNVGLDYVNQKVKELYNLVDMAKTYDDQDADQLFYNWYLSIKNSIVMELDRIEY